MGCPAAAVIGTNLTFAICTHDPDTGALTDADDLPTYRVYEDETAAPILTGTMAKLDDANTLGFYAETIACTEGSGFSEDTTYTIYIEATVDSDTGGITYAFRVEPLTSFAAAVWDRLTAALTTVGSIGAYIVSKLAPITTSTSIALTSPVGADGDVTTIRGDDYNLGDSRQLEWSSADWPDLTGATIAVRIEGGISFAGSVVTPTGTKVVRLVLTDVQTQSIPAGKHWFNVIATQADADVITLVHAEWTSTAKVL